MRESKHALSSKLAKLDATTDEDIARQIAEDPDTAPEVPDEWFEKAEIQHGDRLIRPAQPPLDISKKLVSLRLDQDVIDAFRRPAGLAVTHQRRAAQAPLGRVSGAGIIR
jgi:uncharacterized protein (DUF4415 family)